MKVLLAPDKFKGCLSASEVAAAMKAGIWRVNPTALIDACPMADGGEGTVAALVTATGGQLFTERVTGPLPEMKVDATFGLFDGGATAVIEMSAASGLALLPVSDRNPLNTTTFGTGELIRAAIERGAKQIILGIGGSATNDAGVGCAQACGFTVLLKSGEPTSMSEPLCGRDIENVLMVKHGRGEITNGIQIIVACDVTNPLLGETGAAKIYGQQKGGSAEDLKWLDDQLRSFVDRTGRNAEAETPGAGAAGGLGFGMLAFFGAKLLKGFEIVAEATLLRERIRKTDLIITGEGRLDAQSIDGKVVGGIARLCKDEKKSCLTVVGSLGDGAGLSLEHGITRYIALQSDSMTQDESVRNAKQLIEQRTAELIQSYLSRI